MKKDTLASALDEIDAAYIDEYYQTGEALSSPKAPLRRKWLRLIPVAATAACVAVVMGVWLLPILRREPPHSPPLVTDGETADQGFEPDTGRTESTPPTESAESGTPGVPPTSIPILTPEILGSGLSSGSGFKELGDPNAAAGEVDADLRIPYLPIDSRARIVAARVIEELPHTYESLTSYGHTSILSYRIFRMEILDPLYSRLAGEFYYAMPATYYRDLTAYDALILAMVPYEETGNLVRNTDTGEIVAVSGLYTQNYPHYWTIIPFTDGMFDKSLWDHPRWSWTYEMVDHALDRAYPLRADDYPSFMEKFLVVYHDSTYEEAIAEVMRLREAYMQAEPSATEENIGIRDIPTLTSPEALAVEAYVRPFANGVFNSSWHGYSSWSYSARRYIGGCPTNEVYTVHVDENRNETVTEPAYRFENADMVGLPDVAAYVDALDLTSLTPPHMDLEKEGIRQAYCSAVGFYEKTADGVLCFVKIQWIYTAEEQEFCRDDLYLRLTPEGAKPLSREEMRNLIGDSAFISGFTYEWVGVDR